MKGISSGSTLLNNLRNVYKSESNATDSVGSNNGTAVGGLTYATGKSGSAFKFNGTNSYVNYADNSMNLTGDFTIAFWVYVTASGSQYIYQNGFYQTSPTNIYKGFSIGIDTLGSSSYNLCCVIPRQTTDYLGWQFNSLTNNAWNHVVVTRVSGVDTYAWINNTLSSVTYQGPINSANRILDPTYHTTQRVSIGASVASGTAGALIGSNSMVDEFYVYTRQLTSTERNDLYNSGAGKFYPTF
jgi:hypothetical protein